ncbi:YopX family protein [Oceanobacillus neutriphilus]|uniref:YopX protein domain-containing protein n=1 Tax=Oceanobacillus neutriphilus TaxID=531815 RepID=A0ABQ2P3J6_9BACI|nr:YopX family protein [Oceanobacillus neutriphilus]GGP17296.1 hypothetical protein GCM10011346_52600 [Oceanobacillus neutriphilus]
MRDVLFRGKARLSTEELDELEITHENGWVFGNYIENGFSPYIVGDLADVGNDYIAHEWWVEVIPESVGQWTGKKGIFEGDLVKYKRRNLDQAFGINDGPTYKEITREIEWSEDGFNVPKGFIRDLKVIGKAFENPELLEGATNGSS